MAMTKVVKAIILSDSIMSHFRLNLSAQTPANGAKKKVGKKPQMMDIVIINPDCVFSVMYHMMAYWTIEVPNKDIF